MTIWVVEWKSFTVKRYLPVGPWWETEAQARTHLKRRQAESPTLKYRVVPYARTSVGKEGGQ